MPQIKHTPKISVVMGVYNGEDQLVKTLQSVLEQSFTNFEFIVIDDGSTDGTAEILQKHADKDSRLRVIHQENTGLTRALIHGCSLARGEYIARQDAGDVSLPNRLEVQVQFLRQNPDTVMVGCGTEFVTPDDEVLFQSSKPNQQLDQGLRELSVSKTKGPPHHGGTMYRRDAYLKSGGYRAEFRVAQDIDLWLRISVLGQCIGNEEILYRASVGPDNISFMRWREQEYFLQLAIDSAILRKSGLEDIQLFETINPPSQIHWYSRRLGRSRYFYFLASNLKQSNKTSACDYFKEAHSQNPFHLKALVRWIELKIKKPRSKNETPH